MPHRAHCPTCGKGQTVADTDAGKPLLCSACGTRFTDAIVPRPTSTPPPPVSTSTAAPLPPLLTASHLWLYLSAAVGLFAILLISFLVLERANKPDLPVTIGLHTPLAQPTIIPTTTTAPTTQSTGISTVASSQPMTSATQATTTSPTTEPASIFIFPATTNPTTEAATAPSPARIHPIRAIDETRAGNLDDDIGHSIQRGVSYILGQFKGGRLFNGDLSDDTRSGLDALAVYALIHAGEATADERLGPHAPLVEQMLKSLKAMPMDHGAATYARALRAAALAVYDRPEDRTALRADATWIMKAANNGAYTYEMPPPGRHMNDFWDNSNSQYGALGVWAAEEAGVEVPLSYWEKVEQHWLTCQLPNGQWGYAPGMTEGRLSMTVAGITTLFVAQDQLVSAKWSSEPGRAPFIPALARGLKWLETDDNSINLPFDNTTYNLYGLERAALASGFKYFGTHDWYRELASKMLTVQRTDGAWTGENEIVDTSFTLLFLSRGRHPIFMNKLRFDGSWANRPRDISNLCRYATKETERPMNWQVVSLSSDWSDWMDSPVLFIASHEAPKLQKEDYDKLRSFAENGGLIFTHADGGSEPFNQFIADLGRRIFPDYPLQTLPPDHEIYSSLFKIDPKPKLQGISNGSRLLLLHSPTDLSKPWQLRDSKNYPAPFQLGVNAFIYSAGKANLRNKLKTAYVPEPQVKPLATLPVARLRYIGNWDPEPAGWTRFSRQFLGDTSILINPIVLNLRDLNFETSPVAHLTGAGETRFNDDQVRAVHNYISAGGVLLIDACGGSTAFAQSIRADLLPRAFPKTNLRKLPLDHPILAGIGEGMSPVTMKLRPRESELLGMPTAPLEYLQDGAGCIIFSGLDLSTALLGTNTYTVAGYDPESAEALIRNTLLWIIER